MLRKLSSALILTVLLSTPLFPLVSAARAPPIINRPMEIVKARTEGCAPLSVDPAWAYDTVSGELIFNIYETLVCFDGEHTDKCLPQLALSWITENVTGEVSPEGVAWHCRYTFEVRADVQWHDPAYGTVAPADVEYSFERAMVQDRDLGPQWMIYEPLLNSWSAEGLGFNLSIPSEAAIVGRMIDHSIESNATHVWFNFAFPGAYTPFLQILSQSWSSVMSRQWIDTCVIGDLGRPDWNGVWGDYTDWTAYHNPPVSPLDTPLPLCMGTGPFKLETLDYASQYWSAVRNEDYWQGWPSDFPACAGARPAGYINDLVVTWAYDWPTREAMFRNGDIDICKVPYSGWGDPNINPEDGIRQINLGPELAVDALFYTFDIDPTTPYGNIYPAGEFHEDGIPSDFFGNTTWGIHVRKAFAYSIDHREVSEWDGSISNPPIVPATAIIQGLDYHDPTVSHYEYDLVMAAQEFQAVPGLWDTGFTITLCHTGNSSLGHTLCSLLKTGFESMNSKFHVNVTGTDWESYMQVMHQRKLSAFICGWMADYRDAHNFAHPFYYSDGCFAMDQAYCNLTMDGLVEAGIRTPDGPERTQIYHDIQVLAIEDCPSSTFHITVNRNRYWERDWIVGWYFNSVYPGIYAYNLWKWYYVEEALQPNATYPYTSRIPVDVNYDGKVDMRDIGTVARGFAATYGPPIHPRWNFRADINCDRKLDMKDIGLTAKNFGKTSAIWEPPS